MEAIVVIHTWDLRAAERFMCLQALKATNHNVVEASNLLGITRHSLARRIRKYQITENEVRNAEGT